ATLVPSTKTCKIARCSLSCDTTTTESSAIPTSQVLKLRTSKLQERYFPDGLPSNLSLSKYGCGVLGTSIGPVRGATRLAVQSTISSELLFCALLLLKKFPRIGISPNPGSLL